MKILKFIKKIIPNFILRILRFLRDMIPDSVKYYGKAKKAYNTLDSKKKMCTPEKLVFLLLTPEHGNYGDHAIAYKELELLSKYDVVEITGTQLHSLLIFPSKIKSLISHYPILFNGGGNFGTLWFDIELDIRKTFELFSNNKIIVFPQTIYYENNDFGNKEFENSKKIYNSCQHLILTAREKVSYDIMKSAYDNVYLIPDMVLFLNMCSDENIREGAMFLLRNDVEKTMSDDYRNKVTSFIKSKFNSVYYSDMFSERAISPYKRNTELFKKFDEFKSKKLVLTDRLHGMIFSAITGTPCIVLNSKSHKLKSVYDCWLKNCEYIIFTDSFDEMKDFIESIVNGNYEYDNSHLLQYYNQLKDIIDKELQE